MFFTFCTFRSICAAPSMAVLCSFLISRFPCKLFRYFMSDSEMNFTCSVSVHWRIFCTYMTTKKCTFINTFNQILLFTNMTLMMVTVVTKTCRCIIIIIIIIMWSNVFIKVLLIMKDKEMHYFSNLFDKVLYMFRTRPLSIIRSISTLYTQQYMLVLLTVC
jgi:hypothetical protein